MSQHDHLLDKLCQYPETFSKAKALVREALAKTGPGSGFELGSSKPGLPAICAFIASERLQNDDVSRSAAQEASCLKKQDFDKTYNLIDSILLDGKRTRRKAASDSSGKATFEQLVKKYALPIGLVRLLPCFVKGEKAALAHPDYSPTFEEQHIVLVVFWYVCKIIKGGEMWPKDQFSREHSLPPRIFDTILPFVRKAVSPLRREIREYIRSTRPKHVKAYMDKVEEGLRIAANSAASRAATVPKRQLPTRSSQKRGLPLDQVSDLSPSQRTVAAASTPSSSKKRKLDSTLSLGVAPPTPPDSESGTPINSRTDPFALVSNHSRPHSYSPVPHCDHVASKLPNSHFQRFSDYTYFPPLPVKRGRRYRPIFVDYAQWCSCDTKLMVLRRVGEQHRDKMTQLYGHPLRPSLTDGNASDSADQEL